MTACRHSAGLVAEGVADIATVGVPSGAAAAAASPTRGATSVAVAAAAAGAAAATATGGVPAATGGVPPSGGGRRQRRRPRRVRRQRGGRRHRGGRRDSGDDGRDDGSGADRCRCRRRDRRCATERRGGGGLDGRGGCARRTQWHRGRRDRWRNCHHLDLLLCGGGQGGRHRGRGAGQGCRHHCGSAGRDGRAGDDDVGHGDHLGRLRLRRAGADEEEDRRCEATPRRLRGIFRRRRHGGRRGS